MEETTLLIVLRFVSREDVKAKITHTGNSATSRIAGSLQHGLVHSSSRTFLRWLKGGLLIGRVSHNNNRR